MIIKNKRFLSVAGIFVIIGVFLLAAKGPGKHKRSDTGQHGIVKHVVLISLDGSRPVFYMDKSWPAPYLQRLKSKGVYAAKGIKSVFPSETFPSHTAIITGALPAHNGIYSNSPFGSKPGSWHWFWNADSIQSETLWEAVKKAGMTSGAVLWPVSVGAPITYNFPTRKPKKGEKGNWLTIKYPYMHPKNLLSEVEKKTGHTYGAESMHYKNYAKGKTTADIANYIIKTYKPNLMAIHFVGIDHNEHAHGTDGPKIRKVVSVTDSLVGTVLQAIKDAGIQKSTAVIITGDHGHMNIKATFAPNVYLARHGLITKDGWKAKFKPNGGSAFLHVKNKDKDAILSSVISILKTTPEYRRGDFRILNRKALDRMGANRHAALGLAMKGGITVRRGTTGKPFEAYKGHTKSTHGWDPAYLSMHTTFIAIGAGIGKHKNIPFMGIKDIAPVIAKLLGLKFKAPDGVLIPGIIAEDDR